MPSSFPFSKQTLLPRIQEASFFCIFLELEPFSVIMGVSWEGEKQDNSGITVSLISKVL